MSSLAISHSPVLPWSIDPEEAARFRRIVGSAAVVFVFLVLVLSFVKPPPVDRVEAEKLSPRLAKLIVRKVEAQKAEPVVVKEVPKELPKEPEKKAEQPESVKPAEARPDVSEQPKPKHTQEEVKSAREKASKTGLLAMRDQLAALRDIGSADSFRQQQGKVGIEGTERRVERDLIASTATTGSGGVGTRAIAHSGGGTLRGRETTQVSGPAGAPSLAAVEKEARGSKRSEEEIKLAFDANKSALHGIYRRALRQNPMLEGRVVLKLTIGPSGQVTACSIVSSALNDPDLESKLVARVQLINFGGRPKLEVWTGNYHIDFVPGG